MLELPAGASALSALKNVTSHAKGMYDRADQG